MRYRGSRCGRCAAVCPKLAIRLDERLEVLEERCSGCMTCTTVCPSGALEPCIDFEGLLPGIEARPLPAQVISCGRSGFPADPLVPCLGMLSAEHLVAIFAKSRFPVQLDAAACRDCDAGAMIPHLVARLEVTEEETGLPLGSRIRLIPDAGGLARGEGAQERRDYYRSIRNPAFHRAERTLPPPAAGGGSPRFHDKVLPERRRVLICGLASLPEEAARKTEGAFSFSAGFADSCDGCLSCVAACPTGALYGPLSGGEAAPAPGFDRERCTGCGLCVEFCPSKSLRVVPAGGS